jgi:cell filamentation protein
MSKFLIENLKQIELMPESTFDEIVLKYIEMNIAHPFMEGNGRSARVWLDIILKKRIHKCIDWSQIGKREYMAAMVLSPTKSEVLKTLLKNALTSKINDREMFMKGIDYSYYYEEGE